MNNFIEKILILILVFTTITFGVPLNSNRCNDQGACAQGQVLCVLGGCENDATKVLPRRPPIRVPGFGSVKGPGLSPIFKAFNNFRGKTKTDGIGKNKKYYEWDFTHNDIEVYDNKGKHLGSMDPFSGEMIKPPVNGRINI
jgi:hypothetical protein